MEGGQKWASEVMESEVSLCVCFCGFCGPVCEWCISGLHERATHSARGRRKWETNGKTNGKNALDHGSWR